MISPSTESYLEHGHWWDNYFWSRIYSHLWWCSETRHWGGKCTHSGGLAWLCCYGSSVCSLCVGSPVVRAGLQVLGNSSGSEHSKAKRYSSLHALQEKDHDVPPCRSHSCKEAQSRPWIKMARLARREGEVSGSTTALVGAGTACLKERAA